MTDGTPGDPIQALVLGSGEIGVNVIKQLNKNTRFHVTWVGRDVEDQLEDTEELVDVTRAINMKQTANPRRFNQLVEEWQPDVVFLCERGPQGGLEDTLGSTNLERTMLDENLRIGQAPIITVSLEQQTASGRD